MIQKLGFALLLFCAVFSPQQAMAKKCKGTFLAESLSADVIEEYRNRVKVYLPLRVQLSNELFDCADEIWVEAVNSNKMTFWGPGRNKNGKLQDSQFKQISVKKGLWKTGLDGRETQLWIKLTHYSLFPAGTYTGRVKVSVISKNKVVEEQFLDIEYYSEPKISISLDNSSQSKISGNGGDYQIDLGELVSNARFDWGIKVLSNSAYDIVLDSEYNGLRHDVNASALIDYTISFDNVKISSSEQLTRTYDFFSSVNNTWFGFSFELGNVDLMPAGNYQDNLSLTIYPY
jgi:hypothetical protein